MESSASRAGVKDSWVLTGRQRESTAIDRALDPTSATQGMVLVGDAGVGKTRLARDALSRAAMQDRSTVWAAATESSRALPFGALAGAFGTADDAGAPSGLAGLIAHTLRELDGRSGLVVLGVDDAHLLDDLSAVVVQQIALRHPTKLLLTIRVGQPVPDAITALWKEGLLERAEIAPLGERAAADLLETTLGGRVDDGTNERLWILSRGNPMYLRLLVEGGLDSGRLAVADDTWRWDGDVRLPSGLVELITARIGRVSDDELELLDLLAISEPLTAIAAERLVGSAALEAAESRGLVDVASAQGPLMQLRLAHPLFGEVRRRAMGAIRARRLRGELVGVMADPANGHVDEVLRRAVIGMESDADPQLDLLTAAAQVAARLVDVGLSFRLAKEAVRAGAGFEWQTLVANTAAILPGGDPMAELDRLAQIAVSDGQHAQASVMRIVHLAWAVTEPEAAEKEVGRASSALGDPAALAHVRAVGTMIAAHRGRSADALAESEQILAREDVDADTLMIASCGFVVASALRGSVGALDGVVARALEHATPLGIGVFRPPLQATQVMGLRAAGYLDRAADAARHFVASLDQDGLASAVGASFIGAIDLAEGRVADALPALVGARDGLEPGGDFGGWRYVNAIALAQAQAFAGTVGDAETASRDLDRHEHRTMRFLTPDRLVAQANIAARRGEVTESARLCREAADAARRLDQPASEVVALQYLARLGSASATLELTALATSVEGPRVQVALAHSRALRASDAAALAAVSNSWEQLSDALAAAEAAAQSYRHAESAGDRALARRQRRRTVELIERCQNARTPELIAFERPLPLTAREREVIALLGRGFDNRAIADRLFVSVRTIEGHLYRAGAKLGMDRAELRRLDLV